MWSDLDDPTRRRMELTALGESFGLPTEKVKSPSARVPGLGTQPTSSTMPIEASGKAVTPTASTSQAPNARYDQWSGQGQVTGGDFGRVEGFDAANFADPGMQTAKYQAGRILSRFNPDDPNALSAAMADPEFRALFPNARAVGPDKIDFGDGRPVDVIRGQGAPGSAWAWQTQDAAGTPNPLMGAPSQTGQTPTGMLNPDLTGQAATGGGDTTIAKILAELAALQSGKGSPIEQDALLRLFGEP